MIHCEVYSGNTPGRPYAWLLRPETAPTPGAAVHRMRQVANWLADHLDDDPREHGRAPVLLRSWIEDEVAQDELQDLLARAEFAAQAFRVVGSDRVRYVLTAMPATGCPCRPPARSGPLNLRGARLVKAARPS
ncbi:hypothetical protein [Streptomyces sp. NPDC058486]|uniref:hypothetical protein n=1 Tax=unclassified Streptomyces TaxID=2593676 RepID=UPI0036623CC6